MRNSRKIRGLQRETSSWNLASVFPGQAERGLCTAGRSQNEAISKHPTYRGRGHRQMAWEERQPIWPAQHRITQIFKKSLRLLSSTSKSEFPVSPGRKKGEYLATWTYIVVKQPWMPLSGYDHPFSPVPTIPYCSDPSRFPPLPAPDPQSKPALD